MNSELASTAVGRSWAALFAAVRWDRRTRDPVAQRSRRRPAGPTTRRRSGPGTGAAVPDLGEPALAPRAVDGVEWFELDLFAPPSAGAGSRFDDTVALPIDAPGRLDAIAAAAGLRLRALPGPHDLGHRTVAYRARLQQILRDATQARARLAAGTYGSCLECSAPISLALLTARPWRARCVYCALDI